MKLHRFYIGSQDLDQHIVLGNEIIYHQWSKVLRFEVGREIVLFNDRQQVGLYTLRSYNTDKSVIVELVNKLEPEVPERDIYLCFSLLKKDKNEWVLQKGTELGIRHFMPLITDRTEKIGFDLDRALKIVVEAAEQCGRADIPTVREPQRLVSLLGELDEKVVVCIAEQGANSKIEFSAEKSYAICIGPEGGWSDAEKQLFSELSACTFNLSQFTLRAETAAIVAAALSQP